MHDVDRYSIETIGSSNDQWRHKKKMPEAQGKQRPKRDRVLGDEWLDWNYEEVESDIREGKRIFLVLSFFVLAGILAALSVLWYLILPRFESYGETAVIVLDASVIAIAAVVLLWYILSIVAVFSKNYYLKNCLQKKSNIFITLFPLVMKLAQMSGISKDRLGHSFIMVNNELTGPVPGDGPILLLLPRCLKRDIKKEAKRTAEEFNDTVVHTAPGGNEARMIIKETKPRAIVAVACERDLVAGIHDVAPKIPVIGIPNSRPLGPCKDTSVDIEQVKSAIKYFNGQQ